jgi:hypothetical protein
MPSQRHDEPTSDRSLFVGSDQENEVLAQLLIQLLGGFLNEPPNLSGVQAQGNLSDWIGDLWNKRVEIIGLELLRNSEQLGHLLSNLTAHAAKLLAKSRTEQLERIQPLLSAKDLMFNDAEWTSIEKETGIPRFDTHKFLTILRATRATAICFCKHKQHPLLMIDKAQQGDRQAVLELVTTDKLFLADRCTQGVIRQATSENDERFSLHMASALKHKARMTKHTRPRFLLFALLSLRVHLPRNVYLHPLLDPDGKRFKPGGAFERFVQRSKKEFERLCSIV